MSKTKRLTRKEQDDLEYKEIREYKSKFGLQTYYVVLVCGIIITLIGSYLTITDQVASGVIMPGKSGTGGGQTQVVSGPAILIIGLLIIFLQIRHFLIIRKAEKNKGNQNQENL